MDVSPIPRCAWAESDPLMQAYHDEEWGRPVRDSRLLWETLMLEGFQAGLSWSIILKRRAALRLAFQNFNPELVANFTAEDVERLMQNVEIIRSRAKIMATIGGAQAFLTMGEQFSEFVWDFVGGQPLINQGGTIPTKTVLSEEISKELKVRGFKFVGPTITYAWMQAVGLVNDHVMDCAYRSLV